MDRLDKPQIKVGSLGTIRDLLVLRDLVLLDLVPLVLVPQDLVPLVLVPQDLVPQDLVLPDLGIIQDLDLLVVLEVATVDLGVDREVDRELQKTKRSPTQKR
jgi:hypothetical protein